MAVNLRGMGPKEHQERSLSSLWQRDGFLFCSFWRALLVTELELELKLEQSFLGMVRGGSFMLRIMLEPWVYVCRFNASTCVG